MTEDVNLKIGSNTEQVRQDVDKTAKAAGKALAGSFEQAIGKLARGVVVAKAISDALKVGAEEYKRIIEESKQIGESAVKSRLGQAQTAARLGLGGSLLGTIATASGSTTEEQRASFAAGLSADNGTDINRKAINLQATGLYSDAEITSAVREGRLGELEAGKSIRRSQLGPDYERAVALEDGRRAQEALKRQAVSGQELGPSASQRAAELARLNEPVAAAISEGAIQSVGKVPVVGGLLESGARGAQDLGFRLLGAMEETARNTRGKLSTNSAQDTQ